MAAKHNNNKKYSLSGRLSCLLALLLAVFAATALSAPLKTLTFSCIVPAGSTASKFLLERYNQAWNPLGYRIEFVHAAPVEATRLFRSGRVDGSCGRDRDFAKLHNVPSAVSLQQPSATVTIHSLALRGHKIDPDRTRLNAGYIPTFKRASAELRKMGYGSLTQFASINELIGALQNADIDLAIVPDAFFYTGDNSFNDHVVSHAVVSSQSAYAQLQTRWQHLTGPFSRRLATVNTQANHAQPAANFRRAGNLRQLVFSCSISPEGSSYKQFARIGERVFANLGFSFKLIYLPRLRERVELEKGNIDGSCARSEFYLQQLSENTVTIDVPVIRGNMDVFSRDPFIQIRSVDEFAADATIGFIKGSYSVSHHLQSLNQHQLHEVASITAGLKLLDSGKLDFLVDFQKEVIDQLTRSALKNSIHTAGRLESPLFYASIHRKHARLVPGIKTEMRKIMADKDRQTLIMR